MQFETNVFLPVIEIIEAIPILTDIDFDGDLDLFYVGSAGIGGIMFFRNLENPYQAQLIIAIQDKDFILTWGSIANAVEY